MAKNRAQKEALLDQYKSMLTDQGGFIAVTSQGVEANKIVELKKKLKELGSNVSVVKNTLFKIALEDNDQPVQAKDFADQTAVVSYGDDPTVVAKLIKEVQEETELFDAKFGVINGEFMDGSKVMRLADIPSREELYAKMLGSLMAPLSGFASVVNGNTRGFVQALKQMSEKGGAAPEEAAE